MDVAKAKCVEDINEYLVAENKGTVLDIDFDMSNRDPDEIIKDLKKAHKLGICVLMIGQVAIDVLSISALENGLKRPKDTYKERHLYCRFPILADHKEKIEELERIAFDLGDKIFYMSYFENPYEKWLQ